MNNKTLVSIIVAIVVILLIIFAVSAGSDTPADTTNNPTPTSTPSTSNNTDQNPGTTTSNGTNINTGSETTFTMAEVAMHDDASSCYSVIRGNVYNLTSWISQHPGGSQQILKICGKDGTSAFVGQHGGMEQQEKALASFKIGVLE